jgi:hypothetical protein
VWLKNSHVEVNKSLWNNFFLWMLKISQMSLVKRQVNVVEKIHTVEEKYTHWRKSVVQLAASYPPPPHCLLDVFNKFFVHWDIFVTKSIHLHQSSQ